MAKNMNKLLQEAQKMQAKIGTLQKELESRELKVSSGGGAIEILITGKQEILEVSIKSECIDPSDPEMLEELVKTAFNQATRESKDMVSAAMSKVTGGLQIPGLF